ncbi:MAG: hypothetical protein IJR00_10970, partial [Lachnospiraceae bacterium]|nr:hypothetical protein [Lachnospiraceae bacterium]
DIPVLILYLEVTVAPDEARTHAPARDGFILNNHRRRSLFTEKLSHSRKDRNLDAGISPWRIIF